MLRVGLTGGLASGKSTVAKLFAAHGAYVLQADEIGRELMEPGQAVYGAIVAHFGSGVVGEAGRLDRRELGRIAFGEGRVEELNAIVHPAVIARQAELAEEIAGRDGGAVVMVESALIFETKWGGEDGWRERFDRVILVTAPEEVRVARFVERLMADGAVGGAVSEARRGELEVEARQRMAQQISDEKKSGWCDYVLVNSGAVKELEWQVDKLWVILKAAAG